MKLSQVLNENNLKVLHKILDRYERDPEQMDKMIRDLSMALCVPVLLIFHMIGREIGYNDFLNDRIKTCEEFYQVDSKDLVDC